MNAYERVQAVIEGKIPDRVPVCLHNFLLASREAGVRMEQYRTDREAIARLHLEAVEKYGHDCILLDLRTTLLAEAMGACSGATPDEPGHIAAPTITSLDEVGNLKPVDPHRDGRLPVLLEAVRLLAKAAGKDISIRGNCDQGAFSVACLLRGNEDFLMDLAEDPDNPAIHLAVKAAGAHFTSLGDSFCGPDVVSPAMFEKFSRPYEERLVRELAEQGIFTAIHICGNTSLILDSLARYDYCGFELDYKTDTAVAKKTAGARHALFGNIDPSGGIARGTAEQVREVSDQTAWPLQKHPKLRRE